MNGDKDSKKNNSKAKPKDGYRSSDVYPLPDENLSNDRIFDNIDDGYHDIRIFNGGSYSDEYSEINKNSNIVSTSRIITDPAVSKSNPIISKTNEDNLLVEHITELDTGLQILEANPSDSVTVNGFEVEVPTVENDILIENGKINPENIINFEIDVSNEGNDILADEDDEVNPNNSKINLINFDAEVSTEENAILICENRKNLENSEINISNLDVEALREAMLMGDPMRVEGLEEDYGAESSSQTQHEPTKPVKSKPVPDKIREIIINLHRKKMRATEIAEVCNLKRTTVSNIIANYMKTGIIVCKKIGGYKRCKLNEEHERDILSWVEAEPKVTLLTLADRIKRKFGLVVSIGTVRKVLVNHRGGSVKPSDKAIARAQAKTRLEAKKNSLLKKTNPKNIGVNRYLYNSVPSKNASTNFTLLQHRIRARKQNPSLSFREPPKKLAPVLIAPRPTLETDQTAAENFDPNDVTSSYTAPTFSDINSFQSRLKFPKRSYSKRFPKFKHREVAIAPRPVVVPEIIPPIDVASHAIRVAVSSKAPPSKKFFSVKAPAVPIQAPTEYYNMQTQALPQALSQPTNSVTQIAPASQTNATNQENPYLRPKRKYKKREPKKYGKSFPYRTTKPIQTLGQALAYSKLNHSIIDLTAASPSPLTTSHSNLSQLTATMQQLYSSGLATPATTTPEQRNSSESGSNIQVE